MQNNTTLVLAEISIINFIENIPLNIQTTSINNINKLTEEAVENLCIQPVICYLPKKMLGKSRSLENEMETISLLKKVSYVQNPHLIDIFHNLPVNKAQEKKLKIIFLQDNDSKMMGHLSQMLFLSHNLVESSANGKVDILQLEKSFNSNLPRGKKISDYVKVARKYSYSAFLDISAKTFAAGDKK